MLNTVGNIVNFKHNKVIFKENDFSKDVYIVKTGQVLIYRQINGKVIKLGEAKDGDVFGEVAVIDDGPRTACAIATKDTVAIKITQADFKNKQKDIPDWFNSIAKVIAFRLRETNNKISMSIPDGDEANIASIMLYLSSLHEHESSKMAMDKTVSDLQELLNIPFKEIDNILVKFEKKGFINNNNGFLEINSISMIEKHITKLRENTSKIELL